MGGRCYTVNMKKIDKQQENILGDIKYLTELAKPQIGVVTAIGDIPVHV